ncbi:hypothetical protein [Methylomicrobium sp. Wu6]|uniref:hypothetical protein n=1 Tax=Methylomicrobium sp. Wu6 TaxID=3107928 RepID=UPI002DD6B981|nr:hypothetical protein [Methylomicrobium sp. Wu6]MEC4748109.1 hypothetical protein [Methylomicrobium sp. Wu6]
MSNQNKTAIKSLCRRLVLILGLAGVIQVHAANLPDAQELMQLLGIQQKEFASLDQGKVVSFDVAEGDEKELAAGVVIYLPASPAKIIQFINKKGMAAIDTDVIAQGSIPAQATEDAFKGFVIKAGSDEAKDFLQSKPGSQFNLSTEEFQSLRNAGSSSPDAASQVYRKVLFERWQSYRKNGLKGIATYDRGNGTEANPGGELRDATQANKVLARYFPELNKAWLNYPAALPTGAEERFFWLNRKVEGRPTAILGHRIILSAGEVGEVIIVRQFYVGHSYNSTQLSVACLPYRNGSLLFYANRSFTDQVAGMGSSLKHSIGREQMKGEIIKQLTNLRKVFK